jgi:hypothetical protein
MWWRALLLTGAVGVSLANVLATYLAYDEVSFPHQMISDYVATAPGASIANRAWPAFILSHVLFEARLFRRIQKRRERAPHAYRAWVYSLYGLVFGWLSMYLCLVFDIRSRPREHSVLGGLYGGAWLIAQSIRCAVDGDREKLGLARAPRLARVRLALCAAEAVTAPFLIAGMQLPLHLCPAWLSVFCVACEHVLWVHARTLVCLASYYPDAALLDGAEAPRAPRSAPASPAHLSRVIEAVREHSSKAPDVSKPRKRIGFRAHVVAGPL